MKRSYIALSSLIFVTLSLNLACSKKSENTESTDKGTVKYDLEGFSVSENAKLSDNQKLIAQKVKTNEAVSFELITEEMVAVHTRANSKSKKSTKADEQRAILKFKDLAQSLKLGKELKVDNVGLFKTQYEEVIEKKHKKELIYNLEALNINNIYDEGKLQCYSGTYLNQVTLRNYVKHVNDFNALEPVVIYEEGHVLPGFMKKDKNKEWSLVGIESTVAGQGVKAYGLVKDLDLPIRIVGAHDFALTEIFKGLIKENSGSQTGNGSCLNGLEATLVERAAKKYQIPVNRLEQNIKIQQGGSCRAKMMAQTTSEKLELNQSALGFGQPNTRKGDLKRSKVNTFSKDMIAVSGAKILSGVGVGVIYEDYLKENGFKEVGLNLQLMGRGKCLGENRVSSLDSRACIIHQESSYDEKSEVENSKNAKVKTLVLFPPLKIDREALREVRSFEDLVQLQYIACLMTYGSSEYTVFPLNIDVGVESILGFRMSMQVEPLYWRSHVTYESSFQAFHQMFGLKENEKLNLITFVDREAGSYGVVVELVELGISSAESHTTDIRKAAMTRDVHFLCGGSN